MAKRSTKRVGLKDVAAQAGVSISAVSMALSDSPQIAVDTKVRVREICRELGYPLHRSRRRRQENGVRRVGFVSMAMDLNDEGLAGLLHGLAVHAAARQVRLEVAARGRTTDELASDQVAQLREVATAVDGLLVCGLVEAEALLHLAAGGTRVVVLGHVLETADALAVPSPISSVVSDNLAMGRTATRKLLMAGHRRIGFFCERTPRGLYAWGWLCGYRLALIEAGLPLDPDLVHEAGHAFAGGGAAARAFHGLAERPTAFVCPDIRTASTFIEASRELGLPVGPENLVLGGAAAVAPRYGLEAYPLICEDAEAMAAASLEMLGRLIDGSADGGVSVVVPFGTRNLGEV